MKQQDALILLDAPRPEDGDVPAPLDPEKLARLFAEIINDNRNN
jgi:hypothetical protein